jgi:hypothetical protein
MDATPIEAIYPDNDFNIERSKRFGCEGFSINLQHKKMLDKVCKRMTTHWYHKNVINVPEKYFSTIREPTDFKIFQNISLVLSNTWNCIPLKADEKNA